MSKTPEYRLKDMRGFSSFDELKSLIEKALQREVSNKELLYGLCSLNNLASPVFSVIDIKQVSQVFLNDNHSKKKGREISKKRFGRHTITSEELKTNNGKMLVQINRDWQQELKQSYDEGIFLDTPVAIYTYSCLHVETRYYLQSERSYAFYLRDVDGEKLKKKNSGYHSQLFFYTYEVEQLVEKDIDWEDVIASCEKSTEENLENSSNKKLSKDEKRTTYFKGWLHGKGYEQGIKISDYTQQELWDELTNFEPSLFPPSSEKTIERFFSSHKLVAFNTGRPKKLPK